jgi:hypothetical protein
VSEDEAFGLRAVPADEPKCTLVSESCTNVPSDGTGAAVPDGEHEARHPVAPISLGLTQALRDWKTHHDPFAVRRALLDLICQLESGDHEHRH